MVSYGQQEPKNCIYDSASIKSDFIEKLNVEKYTWDNTSKEAKIITKNGDFVYIKKWACETKGLVARVFIIGEYKEVDKDFVKWKNKIINLASEILERNDFLELEEFFKDDSLIANKFGTDLVFEIKSKSNKKFVVAISPLDRLVIINFLIYN